MLPSGRVAGGPRCAAAARRGSGLLGESPEAGQQSGAVGCGERVDQVVPDRGRPRGADMTTLWESGHLDVLVSNAGAQRKERYQVRRAPRQIRSFRLANRADRGQVVTHLVVKDELLDAQTLRAVGVAPYGGADVGECLATAGRVKGTDLTSWHDAWTSTAAATLALAEGEAAAGRAASARLAFWRASSYFRTAGVMLMGGPVDPRLVESCARQTSAFRRGAALLDNPPEVLQIPYEGTTLPGYFFSAGQRPDHLPDVRLQRRGRRHQRVGPPAG